MHLGFLPHQLDARLRQARHVALVGHTQPDADCLGALTAFAAYAEGYGTPVELYCATPVPPHLRFLPGASRVQQTLRGNYDVVVVLDCGDLRHAQLDAQHAALRKGTTVANIDHHHTNTRFGQLNLVQPEAASTTEILCYYFRQLGVGFTPSLATSLLVGILGDTGGFQHTNTTPAVLRVAADLVSAGASLPYVHELAFHDKTLATLQCWGRVLSRITVNQRLGVATAVVTRADLAGQPDEPAAASGLANFLNTIGGVRAVLVLVEQADGTVRGSLRSKDPLLDVAKFATLMGGGGHRMAAGFTVQGRLAQTSEGWRVVT